MSHEVKNFQQMASLQLIPAAAEYLRCNPPSVPSYSLLYSINRKSGQKERKHGGPDKSSGFRRAGQQRLREVLSQIVAFLLVADDTDPYVEANDYPPSPESWIGEAPSGMEPGPGAGVPYE